MRCAFCACACPSLEENQRYLALCFTLLIPFGAYVSSRLTSSIEYDLVAHMDITKEEYGMLNSAVSWSSLLLVPVVAGYFMDGRPTRYAVIFLTAICTLGQFLFTLAVISRNYAHAIIARFLFGFGESAMLTASGIICIQWFQSAGQVALALGCVEAMRSFAHFIGKMSIIFGYSMGGWQITLWIGFGLCVLSFHAAIFYFFLEYNADRQANSSEFISTKRKPQCSNMSVVKSLSKLFWMFCLVNFFYQTPNHLFEAVSGEFIYEKWLTSWTMSWTKAVWFSSIPSGISLVVAPFVGYYLDSTMYRMVIAICAFASMTLGHLTLGLLSWSPLVGLAMLSISKSCLPTILAFSVPLIVPQEVSGVAFGIFSILENLGKVIGDPLVGLSRDYLGSYVAIECIFAGMAFCALLCCVAIIYMDKEKKLRRDITNTGAESANNIPQITDRTDIL